MGRAAEGSADIVEEPLGGGEAEALAEHAFEERLDLVLGERAVLRRKPAVDPWIRLLPVGHRGWTSGSGPSEGSTLSAPRGASTRLREMVRFVPQSSGSRAVP